MRSTLAGTGVLAAALVAAVAGQAARPGAPTAPHAATAVGFDLTAVDHGGRVESATSIVQGYPEWAPINLIARTPYHGWSANGPELPQEIVFSFLAQQPALIGAVVINPVVDVDDKVPAREVEVWTSMRSPADGFVRAAATVLKAENADQEVAFTPVEARYVKLRLVSAHWHVVNGEPEPSPVSLRSIRVLEARRTGYVPVLARNPELGALVKGAIPSVPDDAVPALPMAGMTSCSAASAPKPPKHHESRRVLVIASTEDDYTPTRLDAAVESGSPVKRVDYSIYGRLAFTHVIPRAASPAHLLSAAGIDTVAISQVCDVAESLSPAFRQALLAWVAEGHKLIIHDADGCGGTTEPDHPNRAPDYSWLPFRMKTVNPGKAGLEGEASLLENSTLASGLMADASFLPLAAWVANEEGNGNELGDSNVIVEHDPHWCGSIFGRNALKKSGFIEAYARFGRGLIIYNGIDLEQIGSPAYNQLVTRELAHPFDPDNLPCSQPLGSFIITGQPDQRSRPMAAGQVYSYPIEVLANFGYSGRVTLEAAVVPADPGVTVKLGSATADLTRLNEFRTSLTVTAAPTASLTSKTVTVRGRDSAGKSNVLCLLLPERTTGSLQVTSGLRRDRKPTKNLEIILDASGSMKALLGKKTRWQTAQEVLAAVIAKLPDDYQVGLRAYGHRESSKSPQTCTDTELVVPVAPLDRARLLAAAKGLTPRGETPLVYSTLQTPGDLEDLDGAVVVLITDGEESCKGDLAAAARTLKDSGLDLTLNIVGFTLASAKAESDLRGLAESTGGRYYQAQNGAALSRALLLAAVDRLPYRVLDAKGAEVAKGTAGVDDPHELPPGSYKVIVSAGEESLAVPVAVALRQDVSVKIGITNDRLAVEP